MTDKSVGSIAWLADMLGSAWAPLGPAPLTPTDPDLTPACPAAPGTPLPKEVIAVSSVPLQRGGSRRV